MPVYEMIFNCLQSSILRELIKLNRTEYWVSQARKFCDFCKCWFADNKVSVSFHENGKKHKENVQKHISTLTKKSAKDAKVQSKIDDDMKKMEEAAMAAYLKDVQNNADLTSQSINQMLNPSGESSNEAPVVESKASSKPDPVWHEVNNDDGTSYYWNTVTNETTWDAPDEYLSVAQQEENKLKDKEVKKQEKLKKIKDKEKQKEALKEAAAFTAREKMKELAEKPKPSTTQDSQPVDYGPAPRSNPYGSWSTVVNEPVEQIDLQLPKPDKEPIPVPVVMEPEVIRFGEKRIVSLGEGPVEFKKRKFSGQRSIRKKLDDD